MKTTVKKLHAAQDKSQPEAKRSKDARALLITRLMELHEAIINLVCIEPNAKLQELIRRNPRDEMALRTRYADCNDEYSPGFTTRYNGLMAHLTSDQATLAGVQDAELEAMAAAVEDWFWNPGWEDKPARPDDGIPQPLRHLLRPGGYKSHPRPAPKAPSAALLARDAELWGDDDEDEDDQGDDEEGGADE